MASEYFVVLRNGTFAGYESKKGWRMPVTERDGIFTFERQYHVPDMLQTYSNEDPSVYWPLRTVAWHIANGFYNTWFPRTYSDSWDNAYFAAFERFKGKCGDSAQLGAAVAEAGEAFSMIASRAGQLFRAARALKRLRFKEFADELLLVNESSSKIRRKVQRAGHDLSSVWLEYSYGWKPLLHDIYDAVKVLESPYKDCKVRGRGKDTQTASLNTTYGRETIIGQVASKYRLEIGATVKVSNPNLAAASQAGLINPLVPLWEILPFSFVVDWFTPVGNFLENFSFGMGLSFTKQWTAEHLDVWPIGVQLAAMPWEWYTFGPPQEDPSLFHISKRYDRWVTNIPTLPKPRLPKFPRDRALNALSLTIQMLSSLQSRSDNPRPRKTRVI